MELLAFLFEVANPSWHLGPSKNKPKFKNSTTGFTSHQLKVMLSQYATIVEPELKLLFEKCYIKN